MVYNGEGAGGVCKGLARETCKKKRKSKDAEEKRSATKIRSSKAFDLPVRLLLLKLQLRTSVVSYHSLAPRDGKGLHD